MSIRILKKERNIRLVLFIVILFLAGFAGVLLLHYKFRVKEITCEGLTYYTEEEFSKRITTGFFGQYTVTMCVRDSIGRNHTLPYIESYEVFYEDSNHLRVKVHEKLLIGCIEVMGDYLYFDKDGYVLEASKTRLPKIPLISGLSYTKFQLYKKLEVEKSGLISVILQLTKLLFEEEIPVDTISFDHLYNVEISCGDCIAELGKRETYDFQIAALKQLLPSVLGKQLILDMSGYEEGNEKIVAKPYIE